MLLPGLLFDIFWGLESEDEGRCRVVQQEAHLAPLLQPGRLKKRRQDSKEYLFKEILTTILAISILFHALIEDHFHKLASYLNSFYIFKKSFYIG